MLRNIAAVLAGANAMPQRRFYLASWMAAAAWVVGYGLSAYVFGETFTSLATPVAGILGVAAGAIVVALPTLLLRSEKRLLTRAERELVRAPTPSHPAGAVAVPEPG